MSSPERLPRLPKSQMFEPVERESPAIGSAYSDRVQRACRYASKGPRSCRHSRIRAQLELSRVAGGSLRPRPGHKPGFLFEPVEHLRAGSFDGSDGNVERHAGRDTSAWLVGTATCRLVGAPL